MKRLLSGILLICALTYVGSSEGIAQRKKGSISTPSAVVYALPKTVLDVKVVAEKTIMKRGPFAEYAEKYMGIKDVVTADGVDWRIESIEMGSHPEVDAEHFYKIITAEDYEPNLVGLTPDGLISGFNLPADEMVKIRKEVVIFDEDESINMEYGRFSIDPIVEIKEDTIYKVVETDTAFVKTPVLETQILKKTDEEKAAEAAHQIFKLRKRRFKILTSNYEVLPPDGKAYEVLVKELGKLEDDYISMFVGKTVKIRKVFHFSFTPKADEKSGVLFRFSPEKGVLDSKDLTGRPVMIEMDNLQVTREVADTPIAEGTGTNNLIFYRIPGQAQIKVVNGKQQLMQKTMTLAQFGKVMHLPSDLLLNEGYRIRFHSEYGSIKSISKN